MMSSLFSDKTRFVNTKLKQTNSKAKAILGKWFFWELLPYCISCSSIASLCQAAFSRTKPESYRRLQGCSCCSLWIAMDQIQEKCTPRPKTSVWNDLSTSSKCVVFIELKFYLGQVWQESKIS